MVYYKPNFQKERNEDMKKSIFQVVLFLIMSLVLLSTTKIALATAKSMSHAFGSGTTLRGIFEINAILKEGNTKGTISYSNNHGYSVNGKITSVIVSGNRADFRVDGSDALIIFGNQVYSDSYVEGFIVDANGSGDNFNIDICVKVGSWPNDSPIYICMTNAPDTFVTSGNITIKTK